MRSAAVDMVVGVHHAVCCMYELNVGVGTIKATPAASGIKQVKL